MPECGCCGTVYSDYAPCCRFCERLREELLERLVPDDRVVSLAVVASRAVNGPEETPERRWRGMSGRRELWQMSHRADQQAREIADRHYNRQKPGTPQFVPPGRCMVLKRDGAFWVTSFPFARYVKHEWAGAYVCSAFRRERGPLASELIKEAVARTVQFHFDRPSWTADPLPALGMVTFIDEKKVRDKAHFGRCYLLAGFIYAKCPVHATEVSDCAACHSRTKKDDLLALQMPLTAILRLWVEFYGGKP